MKTTDIKTAAIQVIEENAIYNCKGISAVWSDLVEKYGRDDAKKVRDMIKGLLKAHKAITTDNARKVTDALKDGERVARAAWADILKDKTINKFAVKVYNACEHDLETIVNKYASYRTTDGRACIKRTRTDENGEKVVFYEVFSFDGSRVASALAMVRKAVNNAKIAAINGAHKYTAVAVEK